jgi:hypothetical protein
MLSLRAGLCALIVLATVGFIVGTSAERHDEHRESPAEVSAERASAPAAAAEGAGEAEPAWPSSPR